MTLALKYLDAVSAILKQIESEQIPSIIEAARMVAESIAKGGILHTFGSGHSHMISEEAFFRAGGLVPVNAILDQRLLFLEGAAESTQAERESGYAETLLASENVQPEDVAIIISNSGRNAVPIEMALAMKARGVKVIAITSALYSARLRSRHSSGKRLFELADLTIDNCVPEGDAVLDLPDTSQRIGPSSTIAGVAIMNAITVEACLILKNTGLKVPVFSSANTALSSDEELENLLTAWSSRIRLFRTDRRSNA